jgi:hypothetical protein
MHGNSRNKNTSARLNITLNLRSKGITRVKRRGIRLQILALIVAAIIGIMNAEPLNLIGNTRTRINNLIPCA